MALKTDYKDDIYSGARKYRKTDNPDGTISLEDVTQYTQQGDTFSAKDINDITKAVNGIPVVTVDSSLNAVSTNPVQNKAIYGKLKSTVITVVLNSSMWSSSKTYTVSNSAITSTNKITISAVPTVNPDSSYLTYIETLKSAGIIGYKQETGKLYLLATGDKPNVNVNIQLLIEGE